MSDAPLTPAAPKATPGWRQRIERYGSVGLTIYLSIFTVCLLGFFAVFELGLAGYIPWLKDRPELASGATFVAAYGLTKLLQPARIAITIAVTPIIAARLNLKLPAPPPEAQ